MKIPSEWSEVIAQMFERQLQLMREYKIIQQLPDPPLSLYTPHCQQIMRDYAWWVTEELAESHEAFIKYPDPAQCAAMGAEELADATHFLIELLIFAGIGSGQCYEKRHHWSHKSFSITGAYWNLTYKLGLAMNHLRNKPWKKTQHPTNEYKFRAALLECWVALVDCWSAVGCTPDNMYEFYFKKAEVLDQRIAGSY